MHRFMIFIVTMAMTTTLGLVGCDQQSPNSGEVSVGGAKRIVVMSPAITQIIIDLGQGDRIVGVGRHDAAADQFTVVGDLYQMDYEKLIAANPTDIFLQPAADGMPPRLRELATQRGWRIHTFEIESLEDVRAAIFDGVSTGVGITINAAHESLNLREWFDQSLLQIAEVSFSKPSVRVVMLVGLNPITTAGQNTFLNEMIVYAGGDNLVVQRGNRYPVLDKEGLVALQPDVIIIAHPGDADSTPSLPGWLLSMDMPAVKNQRVHWLSDPHVLLPSSSVPRITAELAKLLHPDLSEQIDKVMADVPNP